MRPMKALLGAVIVAVVAGSSAAAQDTLKIAIGQINNWENQAPKLGQDAGIFKKHNLKMRIVRHAGRRRDASRR